MTWEDTVIGHISSAKISHKHLPQCAGGTKTQSNQYISHKRLYSYKRNDGVNVSKWKSFQHQFYELMPDRPPTSRKMT